jgi:hypothetical protein
MSWSQAAFPLRRSSVRKSWSLPNPAERRRRCYWRIPLALLVLGAIYKQAAPALLILGALAGAMQLLDAGIGLFQHDLRK